MGFLSSDFVVRVHLPSFCTLYPPPVMSYSRGNLRLYDFSCEVARSTPTNIPRPHWLEMTELSRSGHLGERAHMQYGW